MSKKTKGNEPRMIDAEHTLGSVTDKISSMVLEQKPGKGWLLGFGISFVLVMVLLGAVGKLFLEGTGIWGINNPAGWGFAIVNFVWWIGIGHAGTLISAILFLLKQDWRKSINRFAEAMTIFAVACAGLFPLIHMGRPWLFYWMMPYPNTMELWPQFRSPLVWDVFAVSTYALVSIMFWYVGLVPDLATLRDRAKSKPAKIIYGMLCMGWRGSARHWDRYETAYKYLAVLATPLVISVHTVVSFDFAVGIVPGWHVTVFPPYFVAGAVFAGFAMVLTLALPLRKVYGLQDFITDRHVRNMAKVMLTTGLIVAYGYCMEVFFSWYSASDFEGAVLKNRATGPYAGAFWFMVLCNVAIPQLLWFRKIRHNVLAIWLIAMAINVGMWLERFVIIVTSLAQDNLPAAWDAYTPTSWDWATYVGTLGLFCALLFLFIRFLPVIAIFEMREQVHKEQG